MNLNEGADITRELKIGLPLLTYREIWGGYVYPIFLGEVKAIQVETVANGWSMSQAGMCSDGILEEDALG